MNAPEQTERHAKWKLLIEEQEKSGLSQAEFCKQHNINAAQLSYYRGIFKEKTRSAIKNVPLFSPIQIKKSETKLSEEIKIILPNGFHCYFSTSIEVLQIKKLIEVLLAC